MRNKGFTLIELLAVTVLLGLMTILVVPNLMNTYNEARKKEKELFNEQITEAAKIYAQNHKEDISELEDIGGMATITLQDLVTEGLLTTPVINPVTKKALSLSLVIKITKIANNKYNVEFDF